MKPYNSLFLNRCAKELNQWDLVQEYGSSEASGNPLLVLESAWRVPNWARMKEALAHVEQSYPKELAWKVITSLYILYLSQSCLSLYILVHHYLQAVQSQLFVLQIPIKLTIC